MTLWSKLVWLARAATYVATIGAFGVLGGIYLFQNSLIYPASFPKGSREHVPRPDQFHMKDYENVTLKTKDGVTLTAYLIKRLVKSVSSGLDTDDASAAAAAAAATGGGGGLRQRAAAGDGEQQLADCTLLYLHANAGNMGHRLPIARIFHHRLDCNVFMLSYRGYGLSEGSPSEKGLKIDAQAALDYILSHDKLKHTKIIVYGQSIGGAVAIHLAAENSHRISALIVENTFLSLRKVIPHVIKFLKPFTFLCHQVWDSERAIGAVARIPVLFLSGKRDELIPPQHMRDLHMRLVAERLRAGDTAANIEYAEFPGGAHNDTCVQDGYFDRVEAFWHRHSESQKLDAKL
ncbi:Alpha/Beta hydrolase protein [Entophlyctis helioformis]|nr:Alpha/Beta hydrolase protein [Entophlyctis helioformis]